MRFAERGAAPRAGRSWLLALMLATAAPGNAPAQTGAPVEEKAKVTFSPEVEKKLKEFFDKAKAARGSQWEVRMRAEIEEVEKVTALGAEGRKALDTAAAKAIQLCQEEWISAMEASYREQYATQGDQILNFIDQLVAQAETNVQNDWWFAGEVVQPVNHPAWTGALRETLSPEQMTAAEKLHAEKSEAVGKEIADVLKAIPDLVSQQQGAIFTQWGDDLKNWLTISKERTADLDAVTKKLTEEAAEQGRKRAEKWLLSADPEARSQIIKTRQMYFANTVREMNRQRAQWEQGLAKILSPEELQRVQALRGDLKKRRAAAFSRVLVTLLDEKLSLTAEQREGLRPIAERLVVNNASIFPANEVQSAYWNVTAQMFLTAASKARPEELEKILDAKQQERWKDIAKVPRTLIRRIVNGVLVTDPTTPLPTLPENPEPEDVERALSDVLQEKSVAERDRLLAMNLLKLEDVVRIAKLNPEVVSRLETAARGVTEEMLNSWKSSVVNYARGQASASQPAALKVALNNVRNANFQGSRDGTTDHNANWETTVKAELSEEQRAAWQRELDARSAWSEKAAIGSVMAGFARRNPVTMEQWEKLEPLIAGAVKEYGPDISRMFSSSNAAPWYLYHYVALTPFMAIPEAQLKEILGPERWQTWTGSPEFSNSTNYWENVKRNHEQRLKTKKE